VQPGRTTPAEELSGDRSFTWFTPARRKPSEYESYTVGQQSGPKRSRDQPWYTAELRTPEHDEDGQNAKYAKSIASKIGNKLQDSHNRPRDWTTVAQSGHRNVKWRQRHQNNQREQC